MAVTMKYDVLWGVAPCTLLTLVPRSRIFYTRKMEEISSSETLVYIISTLRHIPEEGIVYRTEYSI
jgi:hypothetical protein